MSASADPRTTIDQTEVVGTVEQRSQALHDLSVAHAELGHLDLAAKLAKQGLRLGHRPERFHLTLAWLDLDRGATKSSLRHLDQAMPKLGGGDLARARVLRGLHLCQSAEPRLAIAELSAVIRELRRHRDDRWLANALIGRGIARSYALRLAEADADFTAAHTLLTALGESGRAAMCLHNKGFVATLAGQLPRALAHYEEAARAGLDSTSRPEALIDRAEALLAAGLVADAGRVLQPALTLLRRCGRGSRLPEALLLAARCALRQDSLDEAITLAGQAEGSFRKQGRPAWIPTAQAVALRARLARGEDVETKAIADLCQPVDAAELRLAAGDLATVAAQRHKGPAQLRALGWLAKAQTPNRREALHACRAGLKVIEDHQAALTTTWPATALTERALDLVTTPRQLLHWAERHRAGRLAYPDLYPPDDPELAKALSALRQARATGQAVETLVALERDIRRKGLSIATEPTTEPYQLPDRLISFTLHRGRLRVVTVTDGRARMVAISDPVGAVHAARLASDTSLPLVPGDDYVVIPDGSLTRMPWSRLGKRLCVVPSIRHWDRAARNRRGGGKVWIAGPGLASARREVRELHEEHGGSLPAQSTVDETLEAMDGAHMVHIAAHGHVRTDHPLFSYLHLKDGPLYGYDLARLKQAPEIVVLSACDSGLARVFLDRGTRVVIASVLPVPDHRAHQVMTKLHRELHQGEAEAVRRAQHDEDLGFICYGAGL